MESKLPETPKKSRKTYYAVSHGHVVKCHLINKADRDGRGKYAANSKRDKRRFQEAYEDEAVARDKAISWNDKHRRPDYGTFN